MHRFKSCVLTCFQNAELFLEKLFAHYVLFHKTFFLCPNKVTIFVPKSSNLFSSKENRGHYIWVQVFCNTPEPFTLMRSILTRHVTSREKFRNRFHEKISPSSKFSFPKKNQNSTCTKNWKMHSLKKCDHIHSLFTLFSGAMGKRPWSAVASSPISRISPRRLPLPASQLALSLRPDLEGVYPLVGLVNPPSSRVKERMQTTTWPGAAFLCPWRHSPRCL